MYVHNSNILSQSLSRRLLDFELAERRNSEALLAEQGRKRIPDASDE